VKSSNMRTPETVHSDNPHTDVVIRPRDLGPRGSGYTRGQTGSSRGEYGFSQKSSSIGAICHYELSALQTIILQCWHPSGMQRLLSVSYPVVSLVPRSTTGPMIQHTHPRGMAATPSHSPISAPAGTTPRIT
jgi:hypothetical protein